ncbi:transcription factor bHLH25 [Citrus sinensis]|uniref:Transcription factor bHLH25 n=1 Tax=Citrus sinensis TaxID=2711 RepID=A0ACB8M276_CITSI|nr:transcription factor bHLH25 [Citrus sinensis]
MDVDQDSTFIHQYQGNSQSNSTTHGSMPFSGLISFQDTDSLASYYSQMSNPNSEYYCTIKSEDKRASDENLMAMKTRIVNKPGQGNRVASRSPLQAQEHVIAERKRREKMNQQFIALSAVIPGIKQMNKASVLEGTIKHLKELQEREKKLVEQTKRKALESVVSVKGSQQTLPDIVVRVSDNNVLIRIHCEKQNIGFISNIVSEIEKLHLVVINSRTIPFGNYALDITVVAQVSCPT